MAGRPGWSRSPPGSRSGTTPACRRRRSLGAGLRPDRPARATGLPQHPPRRQARGHLWLHRLALAGGDDVPGGPPPSRRRDPAPVVGPCHPAHRPGAARVVLADHAVRQPADGGAGRHPAPARRRLVRQARTYLQRRHRRSAPRALVPAHFSMPRPGQGTTEIVTTLLHRLVQTVCYAA